MNRRLASRVICSGCACQLPSDAVATFRCPNAGLSSGMGDDVDHVLVPWVDVSTPELPRDGDPNPFVRYRKWMHVYRVARRRGVSDDRFVAVVRELDERVAEIEGHGFTITPYSRSGPLSDDLGLAEGGVWVKDETGQVAGSHKARHLMGLAIHLEVSGVVDRETPLAIASCGNAALAAAVVARAAQRPLTVFVPTWADPGIVTRLEELEARVVVCERGTDDPPGDPCTHRFRAMVADGAVPFSVQGTENGLVIEGAKTLAWEIARQHDELVGRAPTRIFVQVGGGALASAIAQGFGEATRQRVLPHEPRLHAVQGAGCHPLEVAWRRLVETVLDRAGVARPGELRRLAAAAHEIAQVRADPKRPADAGPLVESMLHAIRHRSEFMRPWKDPHGLADGLLDDETYDWVCVTLAMIQTGGWPLVVDDLAIAEATRRARSLTGVDVSPTGATGLAGLYALAREGTLTDDENVVVLLTGVAR